MKKRITITEMAHGVGWFLVFVSLFAFGAYLSEGRWVESVAMLIVCMIGVGITGSD